MKNQIKIWNPSTGESTTTLSGLREMICERRINALTNRFMINKGLATHPTVMTTDRNNQQVAAHYKSFQIRQFNLEKALSVYNAGGCQVAIAA